MASTPAMATRRFFASRQRVGDALGKPEHPHRLKGHRHPPADLRRRKAEVAGPEGDVLLHRHPHDLALRVLENHPDEPADLAMRLRVFCAKAVDKDLPFLRDEQGVEMFHEGGFPHPLGPMTATYCPSGISRLTPPRRARLSGHIGKRDAAP